jgi:peptidoglycan DL-endopeptidase CwlO
MGGMGSHHRLVRLGAAGLLVVSMAVAWPVTSAARPSPADLRVARGELSRMAGRLSVLVEEYDQAAILLDGARARLAARREAAREADAESQAARAALSERAAQAYTGIGSSWSLLLGASSFTEFSDRLEFLNRLAAEDAEIAAQAERTRERALWAASELRQATREQERLLADMEQREAEIRAAIAEQEGLIDRLERALAKPVVVPPPPGAPPAAEDAATLENPTPDPEPTGDDGPPPAPAPQPPSPPPPPPPPTSSGVQAVIDAARSVLGVRYQWGGSSPRTGFDCSGLTMWAWSHAGVSLPHSSAAQYSALPRVDRSNLQPGDLVFFYSPIHHVGLYIGGGKMIDASTWGNAVVLRDVYWEDYVGAARPR